jgi:ferredoxin
MWMQFASAVADEKQYQQCAFCHKWFSKGEAAAGRRRRREDQTFCTQSCRVKAYQHRQTKARQMRRNGTKLPDIARTVATDLPTLKKWLGE